MNKRAFSVKSRLWIEGKNGTFLGNGRIQLLEKIAKTGSINRAAKEIHMSYRKAWLLIADMNKQTSEPYVIKSTGGKGGGGTEVTKAGLHAIKEFNALNEKCQSFLNSELSKLNF